MTDDPKRETPPRPLGRRQAIGMCLAWGSSLKASAGELSTRAPAHAWSPAAMVRIVVPFTAGGTSDIVARLLASHLAEGLKQTVIVENRAGAGGNIGITSAGRAAPDGQTLLLVSSAFVTNPALYPDKKPYDPVRQFTPVSLVVSSPDVIVVPARSQIRSLADLLAAARKAPDSLFFSTPGRGNSVHLSGELLWRRAGVSLTHAPYSGAAPAVQAVIAEQVDVALAALPAVRQHVLGGTLRAIAVGSLQRWADLPLVPTVAESGFPGYRSETLQALFAPAATPVAIVERLNAEVQRAVKAPGVRQQLQQLGFEVVASAPAELAERVAEEVPRWADIAARAHIRAD